MDAFKEMLDILLTMILSSEDSEKAIVHCSAGIGRTGTTIALSNMIISLWAQLNKGIKDPKISVFSTVRRLREQRFLQV